MNADPKLEYEIKHLMRDTLRNIYYHNARHHNLDRWNKWVNFFVLLSGTATAAGFLSVLFDWSKDLQSLVLGSATSVLGALLLIWDFGPRAKEHQFLAKRYTELFGEIESTHTATIEVVSQWKKKLNELAADEPPTLRALDAVAQNAAIQALEGDEEKLLKISGWQYWMRHMLPFQGTVFEEADPKEIQNSSKKALQSTMH